MQAIVHKLLRRLLAKVQKKRLRFQEMRPLSVAACMCTLAITTACTEKRAPSAPPIEPDAEWVVPDAAVPQPPIDCRNSTGSQDADGDGFSRAAGDCDDCDIGLGPAALDVPMNQIDENCDGELAMEATGACDDELEPGSTDAEDAAHALGLCEQHTKGSRLPGLISARYTHISDKGELTDARQVWLPELFGTIAPREGKRLLAMSTGVARDVNSKEYTRDCDVFDVTRSPDGTWSGGTQPPPSFPKDSSRCSSGVASRDAVAFNDVVLELTLRAPSNVEALAFDSLFFTYEYPDFVCSRYNDFFVVLMDEAPKGLRDGNILFDENEDNVGVNTALLSVCRKAERGRAGRSIDCEAGPDLLKETGFDRAESSCAAKQTTYSDIGGAATGWLHTEVPVKPAEVFTLRFTLWDTGDPLLDSTVLIDNLRWQVKATSSEPITSPIRG